MRTAAAALMFWACSAAAQAQVFARPPSAASVTIYRDASVDTAALDELSPDQGLALITETRTVDVPAAGRVRVAFRGVADTMVPETVALQGLPGVLVERNEDFDLLTPGSLVARSLGRQVAVVSTGPGKAASVTRTATLRSGPNGVLLDFGSGVEALGCGGPPTRLVFDAVPPGLSDKPTFSVLADVPRPGRYTVKLSYLATGFSWSADYVAHIRPDGRSLDLQGWLTLANKSAAGFAHAPTDVVAGDLERDDATRPPEAEAPAIGKDCWGQRRVAKAFRTLQAAPLERREAGLNIVEEMVVVTGAMARQSDLGDYKLYTLPEPTEVAAHQTKQVAFLDLHAVPFERVYVLRLDPGALRDRDDPQAALAPTTTLRLKNRADRGLGKPLPSGTVAVMERASGAPALAGEQRISDTAIGLPLELELGRALDVPVTARVADQQHAGHTDRATVVLDLANAKSVPIVVELRQPMSAEDARIERASAPSTLDKGDRVWTLHLNPGQSARLTYVLSVRD